MEEYFIDNKIHFIVTKSKTNRLTIIFEMKVNFEAQFIKI